MDTGVASPVGCPSLGLVVLGAGWQTGQQALRSEPESHAPPSCVWSWCSITAVESLRCMLTCVLILASQAFVPLANRGHQVPMHRKATFGFMKPPSQISS